MIPIVGTGPWKKHTKHTQCTYVCEYKLATENGEASYYIKKKQSYYIYYYSSYVISLSNISYPRSKLTPKEK